MANRSLRPAPGWFKAAALAALVWELFGCTMYILHITADRAGLPPEQAAMWAATPAWSIGAYAVAVWIGLLGAILLMMRRRLAEPLLLVSLIAVVVQFSAQFVVPELRAVTPQSALAVPIVIIVACIAIWLLARRAKREGWLR
ncbi:MAG TPA: hypothetical protein VD768_00860 [Sphingomicrobium sp.]|nr:hypothetical protein [Sphingomicrobium sp.]